MHGGRGQLLGVSYLLQLQILGIKLRSLGLWSDEPFHQSSLKFYIYLFNVFVCLCFCACVGTLVPWHECGGQRPWDRIVSFHQVGLGSFLTFFLVSLTMSGMNYNQEMESTPVKDFLFGLQWVNLFLFQTFEVGRHTSDLDLQVGGQHAFGSDIEIGRHPLIWALLSAGSLYKEEGRFALCSFVLTVLKHLFLPWSLLLQDSSIYRGPAETPSLVGLRNYQILGLPVHSWSLLEQLECSL